MAYIGIFTFILGLINIINNRNNYIIILISLELILIAISLFFISSGYFFDDLDGILTAIFILTIGAAESSIGLTILIVYYRNSHLKLSQ